MIDEGNQKDRKLRERRNTEHGYYDKLAIATIAKPGVQHLKAIERIVLQVLVWRSICRSVLKRDLFTGLEIIPLNISNKSNRSILNLIIK